MDNLQRAVVSLLIDGDDLVPSEITALLGAEPRLGIARGEEFRGHQGTYIRSQTGKWYFGDDWKTPVDLDVEISCLLGQLTDDLDKWKYVTDHFHCYIAVGAYFNGWTGGITLSPQILGQLADRRLAIDFDLYAINATKAPPS